MATVSKKDICKVICESTGRNSYEVEEVVKTFMDKIIEVLAKGDRLEFREFGVFELRRRRARQARNPKTGAAVQVPERTVVAFKPGKIMRESVSNVMPAPR